MDQVDQGRPQVVKCINRPDPATLNQHLHSAGVNSLAYPEDSFLLSVGPLLLRSNALARQLMLEPGAGRPLLAGFSKVVASRSRLSMADATLRLTRPAQIAVAFL